MTTTNGTIAFINKGISPITGTKYPQFALQKLVDACMLSVKNGPITVGLPNSKLSDDTPKEFIINDFNLDDELNLTASVIMSEELWNELMVKHKTVFTPIVQSEGVGSNSKTKLVNVGWFYVD